jgi:hypothetical protein
MNFIKHPISTSSYRVITRAIRGLSWFHKYNQDLSLHTLLSLPEIQSFLSQATAVLFCVGTNSVRVLSARQIISQVEHIVLSVQQNYPHLNQPGKISISLTFPCFKTTYRFPTETSLISNINLYNEQLKILSSQMNFNILDFEITNSNLANDYMHIQQSCHADIIKHIINHFDQVIQTTATTHSISSLSPTSDPNLPLPSSSSDQIKSSKNSKRSSEAQKRHNKQRSQILQMKHQQHTIKKKIYHQWTVVEVKQYLDSLHIPYVRIPPIYKNLLKIHFRNQDDQDLAAARLEIDLFNENKYKEFISHQSS